MRLNAILSAPVSAIKTTLGGLYWCREEYMKSFNFYSWIPQWDISAEWLKYKKESGIKNVFHAREQKAGSAGGYINVNFQSFTQEFVLNVGKPVLHWNINPVNIHAPYWNNHVNTGSFHLSHGIVKLEHVQSLFYQWYTRYRNVVYT